MKSKIFVLSVTILFLSSLNLFAQSSYKKTAERRVGRVERGDVSANFNQSVEGQNSPS